MSENHAIVLWHLDPSQLPQKTAGMAVLNIDPSSVPGMEAFFDGGFTVVSHTLTPIIAPGAPPSMMLSIYLRRTTDTPSTVESLTDPS